MSYTLNDEAILGFEDMKVLMEIIFCVLRLFTCTISPLMPCMREENLKMLGNCETKLLLRKSMENIGCILETPVSLWHRRPI